MTRIEKKTYQAPEAVLTQIHDEDVLTSSGGFVGLEDVLFQSGEGSAW